LNKKQRKRNKKREDNARVAADPRSRPTEIPQPPDPEAYENEQRRKNNLKESNGAMKTEPLSNWFLVAFTAALVVTGILQWDAIKGQLKAMVDADRPWIGSYAFSAEPIEIDKDGSARISVINSGRGPARILSFKTELHVFDDFPPEPPYGSAPLWMNGSHTILLPGMTANNEFPFTRFSPAQLQSVLDGKAKLYIYGVLEYEDLRVKNSRHTTKICAYWTAKKLVSTPFVNCPEYNEAD